jgi:hypothetical protein
MYLSSLFCFLLEIFGCCARRSSFNWRRFSPCSVFATGIISVVLESLLRPLPDLPSRLWVLFILCLRWRGTNFGIVRVGSIWIGLRQFSQVTLQQGLLVRALHKNYCRLP